MRRRDFLKFLGLGGVGTGLGLFFGRVSKPPGAKLVPYLIPPEDIVPGVADWYSTLCTQCGAGCGVLVRVMEGRAKKIEGNPLHPVSMGKLCARGQTLVQGLYHPDRVKTPLRRIGPRGSGNYTEASWDEALSTLAENLAKLKEKGRSQEFYLLASSMRGHLGSLVKDFMAAYGSPNYFQHGLLHPRSLMLANRVSLGVNELPHYDIANTKYLLSFGADFTCTWISPVNMSRGYGEMRQGEPARRGKLVQIEPRMSVTGANADEWVPVRPGTEGVLALAIAHVIVEEGRYTGADRSGWRALLRDFTPAYAEGLTEVSEHRIRELAEEFTSVRPSLAIGGENLSSYSNGVSSIVAVNILNHLAGSIGKKGGMMLNPEDFPAGLKGQDSWKGLSSISSAMNEGRVQTLLLYDANPVFSTPERFGLEKALEKVPFIVSLGGFMDETTVMSDLILPVHATLEDWGDDVASPSVGYTVATIQQPAVTPLYSTMGPGDVLLGLSARLRARAETVKGVYDRFLSPALSRASYQEYLKESWREFYQKDRRASSAALTFEDFWKNLLKDGGWWPEEVKERVVRVSPASVQKHLPGEAEFEGGGSEYPFYLILYPHQGHLDGRGANLPWMQEFPDPLTTVVWGSWVEVNPATAKKLGIKEGDMVGIESPFGKVYTAAYLYPGIRPDTVAIPIGQGHSSYGRYAQGRGVNPIQLLPAREDASGSVPLNSTRVRIERGATKGRLVKIESKNSEYGRGIVQTISPEEYKKLV